jgi:uncharacterized protein
VKRCCVLFLLLLCFRVWADEIIPPKPDQYFNDYANVVSPATASQLNSTLKDFERQTSDQIVVTIFPTMQSDSSIEDYTVRVARAWKVGQQDKKNGVVLFIFVQNHQMLMQVGYGLEGVLPDALCKRIIDEQISPRFHNGDFDGGLTAGVQAIMAAAKGEYKGTGVTIAESQSGGDVHGHHHSAGIFPILFGIIFTIIVYYILFSNGRFPWGGGGIFFTGGGWGSSGGSWGGGGGGGFSGGGGGFSGGGGSFGGGGAGGSW